MSNDIQIKLSGEHGASVTQQVQYGIKFPDGTTAWTVIPNTSLDIKALVEPTDRRHDAHHDGWVRVCSERSAAARVDTVDYIESHKFIKRTVVLSVTDTEEV